MILVPLVFVALPTPEVVMARLNGFLREHAAISAKFTFSSAKEKGAGTITLRFPKGSPMEVDWVYQDALQRERFVTAHGFGLSINYTQSSYDRGVVDPLPAPSENVVARHGYPTALVTRGFDAAILKKSPGSVKAIEGGDRLTCTVSKGGVKTQLELDVDGQGRLFRMHVSEPPDQGSVFTFSNYKVDSAAAPSSFETDPPLGCVPFAFDETYTAIAPGQTIPAISVNGAGGTTTLAALARSAGLLAFVDDPVPAGLLDSLKRISNSTPVTLITLGTERPAGFTTYSATEQAFNDAGIQATPQFYLVKNGTLVQGWLGFRKDLAAKFEAEVKSFLSGAR